MQPAIIPETRRIKACVYPRCYRPHISHRICACIIKDVDRRPLGGTVPFPPYLNHPVPHIYSSVQDYPISNPWRPVEFPALEYLSTSNCTNVLSRLSAPNLQHAEIRFGPKSWTTLFLNNFQRLYAGNTNLKWEITVADELFEEEEEESLEDVWAHACGE